MHSLASTRRLVQITVRKSIMTSAAAASNRRVRGGAQANATTDDYTLLDNPCWGSPAHCSLSHLITKYPREKSILLEAPDYIVLNKPPDLRMDGNYPATVQKLLLYWYPPPSLLETKEKDLLEIVSNMSNPPVDLELRHCHQLDYATSGVLLLARSKQAANVAMQAFRDRKVEKAYLAMVHGHISIDESWPVLPKKQLDILQQQEAVYRTNKAKRRNDTFEGFMPPHAMFQKFKAHHIKKQQDKDNTEKKQPKRPRHEENKIDLGALWSQALDQEENDWSTDEVNEMASSTWKQVKRNSKWKQAIERLGQLYNDTSRLQYESTQESINCIPSLPKLFRIQGEPENAFYICAPLAEVGSEFSMRVIPDTLPEARKQFEGTPDLDYKPSLTRCVILENGTSKGHVPITKVQLEPRTGRRHQLRVHMLIADTAIVGDATYEPESMAGIYPRMCLHAHSLSLPVLGGTQLSVSAPDPFSFDKDQEQEDLII